MRNLVDIASKGGNYLLNVGPTAEGEIPAPSRERLAVIGAWMKINGESVHGTTATLFAKYSWDLRSTTRRNATPEAGEAFSELRHRAIPDPPGLIGPREPGRYWHLSEP